MKHFEKTIPGNQYALKHINASLISCSGKEVSMKEQSMESIQAQNGIPVRVWKLVPESFSVYLKYPTTLLAHSESTAYALLNDVVRDIKVKVGDRVVRDQTVLSFSHDNTSFLQEEANFRNTEAAFKRSSALFAEAGLSRQEYDNLRTQYEVARASCKSASDMVEAKAPIEGYVSRINVRAAENVARRVLALAQVSYSNGLCTQSAADDALIITVCTTRSTNTARLITIGSWQPARMIRSAMHRIILILWRGY